MASGSRKNCSVVAEHSPYQAVILDHYRNPRGQREVIDELLRAEVSNPVCGDRLRLGFRDGDAGALNDLHYHAKACAVATASASLMWEYLGAETDRDVLRTHAEHVLAFLDDDEQELEETYAALRPLEDLRAFPMRLNCAKLPWKALLQSVK